MTRIVTMKDTEPLKVDPSTTDKAVWVCRCGLSAAWPYCDGSHKQTRDEEPGRMYAYRRTTPGAPLARDTVADAPDADPRPEAP